MQDSRCDYFEWYDMEIEGRHGDVIIHLNNRRIYLENSIGLLEEKISMLESKLEAKKQKNQVLQKTAKSTKIYCFVIVLLMAMLVMNFQRSASAKGGLLCLL